MPEPTGWPSLRMLLVMAVISPLYAMLPQLASGARSDVFELRQIASSISEWGPYTLGPSRSLMSTDPQNPQICDSWGNEYYYCNAHRCNCQRCGTGGCHTSLPWGSCSHGGCGDCWCSFMRCKCCWNSETNCNCQTCYDRCSRVKCTADHSFEISGVSHAVGTIGSRGHTPTVTISGSGFINSKIQCWFLLPGQVPACVWPNGKVSTCRSICDTVSTGVFVDENTIECPAKGWVASDQIKNTFRVEISVADSSSSGGNYEGITNNGFDFTWYKCPSDCSGHGDCKLTGGDSARCECDAGYFGDNCGGMCPGFDNGGEICSGHGECSSTGLCTCEQGFFGGSCELECPGGADTPCSNHGQCNDHGVCICDEEWRGASCSNHCPIAVENQLVCAGHGECNSAGRCRCDTGYWNEACDKTCPGGADTPCSNHGTCLAENGECLCEIGWVHTDCSNQGTCEDSDHCTCTNPREKYGPGCNQQCQCNGHGKCSPSGACECDIGYWGAQCQNTCPGGVGAATCSGHGECSQVDGTCSCNRGWGGDSCSSACASQLTRASDSSWTPGTVTCEAIISTYPGYYGRRRSVQGTVRVSNTGTQDLQLSYNLSGLPPGQSGGIHIHAGTSCTDPNLVGRHYYTPHATGDPDPWTAASARYTPTSSSGATYGSFTLRSGFQMNPSDPSVRGHAVVVHTSGVPLEPSDRIGCGVIRCGRDDAPPELCGGPSAGRCNEEGHCECTAGHWKEDCSGICPIHDSKTCNGHGNCSLVDGLCGCFTGWTGISCEVQCPGMTTGTSPQPCSGHGTCLGDGTCACIKGYWGPTCAHKCPGFVDAHVGGCSGHGVCSHELGKCTCQAGYFGDGCEGDCPTDSSGVVCGGHGFCKQDGSCQCNYGWNLDASGACTQQCPGGSMNICFGHGHCNSNGQCSCMPGYAGTDCNAACPSNDPAAAPCNYPHGICQADTLKCQCNEPFGGDDCTSTMCPDDCNQRGVCHGSEGCRCELGFWGRACEGVCPGTANKPCGGPYQGVCQPDGKCVCHDGFFGEDCMQTCPRTDLGLCNNQGYCDSKIGSCSCKTGWYGTHCEKRMQSPDPANTVEILLNDCRASDGEWLFALLDKIATHFEVTPQRLQFKSCIDVVCNSDGSNCIPARRAGLQMLPLELYGVPGQTSSAEIAQNISLELRRDPNVLGTDFKVSGAQIHQDPSSNNGKGGVGTGAIVALVIISMLIAVVASMLYFKMDTVQALYRRARRFVKSRILGEDGLDVDEDGVTYGDGHAGQMHKANVEISYELEGTHEVDDRDNEKIEDSPLQIPEQCKPDPESEHANL